VPVKPARRRRSYLHEGFLAQELHHASHTAQGVLRRLAADRACRSCEGVSTRNATALRVQYGVNEVEHEQAAGVASARVAVLQAPIQPAADPDADRAHDPHLEHPVSAQSLTQAGKGFYICKFGWQ